MVAPFIPAPQKQTSRQTKTTTVKQNKTENKENNQANKQKEKSTRKNRLPLGPLDNEIFQYVRVCS